MLALYFDRLMVITAPPIVRCVRLHSTVQRLLHKIRNSPIGVTTMIYTDHAASPSGRVPLNWLNDLVVLGKIFV